MYRRWCLKRKTEQGTDHVVWLVLIKECIHAADVSDYVTYHLEITTLPKASDLGPGNKPIIGRTHKQLGATSFGHGLALHITNQIHQITIYAHGSSEIVGSMLVAEYEEMRSALIAAQNGVFSSRVYTDTNTTDGDELLAAYTQNGVIIRGQHNTFISPTSIQTAINELAHEAGKGLPVWKLKSTLACDTDSGKTVTVLGHSIIWLAGQLNLPINPAPTWFNLAAKPPNKALLYGLNTIINTVANDTSNERVVDIITAIVDTQPAHHLLKNTFDKELVGCWFQATMCHTSLRYYKGKNFPRTKAVFDAEFFATTTKTTK